MSSDPHVARLVTRHLSGHLSAAEASELEELLARSPDAREALVRATLMELDLLELHGAIPAAIPSRLAARHGGRRFAAALCALLLGLWSLQALLGTDRASGALVVRGEAFRDGVERVSRIEDGDRHLALPGTRIALRDVDVTFRERSVFRLDGAARGPDGPEPQLELEAGSIRVETRSDGPSPRLAVRTPQGVLRDIGTRFEVDLSGGRGTEDMLHPRRNATTSFLSVLVLAGLVQFAPALRPDAPQELAPSTGRTELHQDGSLGAAKDREGLVQVRRRNSSRWVLLHANDRLRPGDLVRAGSRGAHAATLRLANETRIVVGPGSQIEIEGVDRIHHLEGEIEVRTEEGVTVTVRGPADVETRVRGTRVLRAGETGLVVPTHRPRWLEGYLGDASTDALGSLLAQIDGRNVPLTMGYHKVQVDIRDQIAQTVVEESFVNHTSEVLEGTFYFPLPADASISGFAMWVGNEKVHGEIVEKQRAREIYETILRERRDPGLLEWTGGNLFQARVFPIVGEKRIEIRYTQVLPREGDAFRYHYALRSDLTRETPLERLEIAVTVSSAAELAEVSCDSHPARVDRGAHAARIELSQREVVPRKDFECTVRLRPDSRAVHVVPHVRGGDGWFLAPLELPTFDAAPRTSGGRTYVLLVDTSGSMALARERQVHFLEALLASLDPADRFQLATIDTALRFAFPAPLSNDAEARAAALRFVDARPPLGWSDLGAGFAGAFDAAARDAHVVYLGDGIETRRDADSAALLTDLRAAWKGRGTVHAIAFGNTWDALLVQGLARLRTGIALHVTDGDDVAGLASAFVRELEADAYEDVRLAFEDVRAAAVHPERLARAVAGQSYTITGRFDPRTLGPNPRMIVTARRRGEEVRFAVPFANAAGTENSFLPRLWARRELDHLLEQGSSELIRERIRELSSTYQVITPYTSFLVLESDADRERFGVGKTMRLRDGEEYFAEGRRDADFELVRQQMLLARLWRRDLQRGFLEALRDLGRGSMDWLKQAPDEPWSESVALGDSLRFAGRKLAAASEPLVTMNLGTDVDKTWYADEFAQGDFDLESGNEWNGVEALEKTVAPREMDWRGPSDVVPKGSPATPRLEAFYSRNDEYGRRRPPQGSQPELQALAGLVPSLDEVVDRRPPSSSWPAALQERLRPFDRRAFLITSAAGLHVRTVLERFDPRGRSQGEAQGEAWLGPHAWWQAPPHLPADDVRIDWFVDGRRGVRVAASNVQRSRRAAAWERDDWSAPLPFVFESLAERFARWEPALEEGADGRLVLTLSRAAERIVLELDPVAGQVLAVSRTEHGRSTGRTTFDAWVEVAGRTWPTSVAITDGDGRRIAHHRLTYEAVATEALADAIRARVRPGDATVAFGELPARDDAERALHEGRSGLEDEWIAFLHAAGQGDRARARELERRLATRFAGKDLHERFALLGHALFRRHVDGMAAARSSAERLAADPAAHDRARARTLLQDAAFLTAAERLELVDALRAVWARGADLEPLLAWHVLRADLLAQTSDTTGALAARRALVTRFPTHVDLHRGLAWELARRSLIDEAIEGLGAALATGGPWVEHERRTLAQTLLEIELNARRIDAALARVESWDGDPSLPTDAWREDVRLTLLLWSDRVDAYVARIRSALRTPSADEPEAARAARDAAVRHALGSAYQLWRARFDDRWETELAELARATTDSTRDTASAERILTNDRFGRSAAGRAVLRELWDRLEAEPTAWSPAHAIRLHGWLRRSKLVLEPEEDATQRLRRLVERWIAAGADDDGDGNVRAVVGRWGDADDKVRVHAHLARFAVLEEDRLAARRAWFESLLQAPWSAERETQVVDLLTTLEPPDQDLDGEAVLAARLDGLTRVANWAVTGRARARLDANPAYPSMTRRRARELELEARRAANDAFATTLPTLALEDLRAWIELERLHALALAGRLAEDPAFERALELFAAIEREGDVPWSRRRALRERVFAHRVLCTAAHFALFPEPRPERVARLREHLARQDAQLREPFDPRHWIAALELALGEFDTLQTTLRAYAGDGTAWDQLPFTRQLAMTLAEEGRFEEAIPLLQRLAEHRALDAPDHRTLAAWHQVQGARDAHEAQRRAAYDALSEPELARWLDAQRRRVSRTRAGVPEELDPETPWAVAALLRRTSHPEHYAWTLRTLYESTRDHRVLGGMAHALPGLTGPTGFALLEAFHDLIAMVQEEATVDALVATLETLRGAADPADHRRLACLELRLRHRALELRLDGSDHRRACHEALDAAVPPPGETAEQEGFARFLARFGSVPDASLVSAMRERFAALEAAVPPGAAHHAVAVARSAFQWDNGERTRSVDLLRSALDEVRSADGTLDAAYDGLVGQLADRLRELGRLLDAETFWRRELETPLTPDRRWQRIGHLMAHYVHVVTVGGDTLDLGRGAELVEALDARFRGWTSEAATAAQAETCVQQHAFLLRQGAERLGSPAVRPAFQRLAQRDLPQVLGRFHYQEGQDMVGSVAAALEGAYGPAEAVRFFVIRAGNEPRWLRLANQDLWARHAWRLGRAFESARDLPASVVEDFAALVLDELRADLSSADERSRVVYSQRHRSFWSARIADFERVARAVAAEHPEDSRVLRHVARYLEVDLGKLDGAIAVLLAAHRRGSLDADGQLELCAALQRAGRHGESLPILLALDARRPDHLPYRRPIVIALAESLRVAEARAAFEATIAGLEARGLWNEAAEVALGETALDVRFHDRAAALFEDAIARHVRDRVDRGMGNGTLGPYYRNLSRAYRGLGRTNDAVDALAGAILAWSRHQSQRAEVLQELKSVLEGAEDLAAYVAHLDAEVARTGVENPILRQAVGQAWLHQKQPGRAVEQFAAAVAVAPEDLELQRLLVQALDAAGRPSEATQRLLESARRSPRSLELFGELGERLARAGDPEEAERARTNLVEARPGQSEGHALLAAIREDAQAWDAAVDEWRAVARLRSDEPTGLLGVARNQIAAGHAEEARRTLAALRARPWPTRFADLEKELGTLEAALR